ncbi:MAG: GlxA family transcriptional regulator [Pseudomonadota bacterium]
MKIDVLLFEHFSNHCLANTIEPIRAANALADEALYQWRYVSLDGGEVVSSSGLPVATEKLDVLGEKVDLLFAMPSYGFRELATPVLCSALRQAEQRTKTMVGFDTGAWLFAAAGLLDGKKATIHSAILDEFSEQFLSVSVRSDRFVIDGDYMTCGGAMAAFDLALHLIGIQYGAMLKHDVEAFFLYQNEPPDLIDHKNNSRSTLVRRALRTMDDNLETSLTIQQIAQQLDTNVKELQRRFSRSLGMTPAQVLRHKKLNHAKTLLLSTQMPIAEITVRCGYENASAMTRAFKQKFGSSPLSYRLQSND